MFDLWNGLWSLFDRSVSHAGCDFLSRSQSTYYFDWTIILPPPLPLNEEELKVK